MSLAKHNPLNEMRELHSNEAPTFDDIYVPGIGVRGALDDDAERFDFRSDVRERFARGAAFVSHWAMRTFGAVRGIRSRLAIQLMKTDTQTQTAATYRSKLLRRLKNSHGPDLQRIKSTLYGARNAVNTFRIATKTKLALSPPLAQSVNRSWQGIRPWLLRGTQIINAQIHRANQYRQSLPPIRATLVRNVRGTPSFLRSAVIGTRNRLRADAHYKVLLRVSASYKPDLATLRRAAAPLAILLVMVVFVIQQIVVVIQR
jgi:hypothetical protein